MIVTIGAYLSTGFTFINGARRVTVYGLPNTVTIQQLKKVELLRPDLTDDTLDTLLKVPSTLYGSWAPAVPLGSPTAGTPSAGGTVTVGTHSYKFSYVFPTGETLQSGASNVVTTDLTNKTVALTGIGVGPSATIARNIYRTNAGGTTYYLVATISDNTTTTYTDTAPDNTTTIAPVTTTAYDFTWVTNYTSFGTTISTVTANTGDSFNIELDVKDATQSQELGYVRTAEVAPVELKTDLPRTLCTAQTFTTSLVTAGSAWSAVGRNVHKVYAQFTVGGLTSARFKIFARKVAGDTPIFPIDVVFDKPSRVIEIDDSVTPYMRTFQLSTCATQVFTFDIYTNVTVAELEIKIIGVGTMTSSAITFDVISSFSPTACPERKNNKLVTNKIVSAASGSTTIPNFIWAMIVNNGVANVTITNVDSEVYTLLPNEWVEYSRVEGIQNSSLVVNSTSSYKLQYKTI